MAGRPILRTKEEVQQAIINAEEKGLSVHEVANNLQVSTTAFYSYLRRFKLKFNNTSRKSETGSLVKHTFDIYNAYRNHASAKTLAKEFNVTAPTIRHHLLRAIEIRWMTKQRFPKPTHVHEIRIVHLLETQPAAVMSCAYISTQTGLTINEVNDYLALMKEPKHATSRQRRIKQRA